MRKGMSTLAMPVQQTLGHDPILMCRARICGGAEPPEDNSAMMMGIAAT